jgi:hypothetical protein
MSMNEQILRSEINYRAEQGRIRDSWSRIEGRDEDPIVVRRRWRKVRAAVGR